MRNSIIIPLLLLFSITASAQEQESNPTDTSKATSLLEAFQKGKLHGQFRYFFMATDNEAGLTDYHAHALGGGVSFRTARFHGFQIGVGGFFIYNIGASDFTKTDPATGGSNRYEIGLFDITNPSNKNNIDRLEELYLQYSWKQNRITAGKQLINTPFINLQDGRMRPTEVGGIWVDLKPVKKWHFEGGYLYQISPRSTVDWYKPGASIGIYPTGVNPDGSKSQYAGNTHSNGVALLGITHQMNAHLQLKTWDQWIDNISNTWMLQPEGQWKLTKKGTLKAGVQVIGQNVIGNGGNADPAKAYESPNGKAYTIGATLGWLQQGWDMSLNVNRITSDGRFLMPREWGREPFYTFLPREIREQPRDLDGLPRCISARGLNAALRQCIRNRLHAGHAFGAQLIDDWD
ncbi:MAG TPA: OprD family outer membrane porin, partial [Ferruginibacter sp.]|nr:OprD family outer membrane porin [Ferruginibacter sp.]